MEQLPMQKRSTAPFAVMVAIVLMLVAMLTYMVHASHSTISSLQSELSEKDKIIDAQDDRIHEQQQQLETKSEELDSKEQQLQESTNKVQELEKEVTAMKEKRLQVQMLAAKQVEEDKQRQAELQSGWKATFYSLGIESTGKRPGDRGYGITKSGRKVSDVTIAVDPNVIPLGTWVEIQMPDGTILKKRADDTGSAIKGKKIDIYVPNASKEELYKLGVKQIQVRILKGVSEI